MKNYNDLEICAARRLDIYNKLYQNMIEYINFTINNPNSGRIFIFLGISFYLISDKEDIVNIHDINCSEILHKLNVIDIFEDVREKYKKLKNF
jgi:hypothetical protein